MIPFFRGPPALSVQPLLTERAADCASLHGRSFSHPWSEAEFERLLAGANIVADAAFSPRDVMLGFILSRLAADEAEVLTIVTDPTYRAKGIGRRLLSANLDALTRHGVRRVFLEVEEGNVAAVALYDGAGFRNVGRRESYYRKTIGSPAAAVIMRKDLG
jgi:ribosomal-protein-alanine N-acetyltransferase